MTTVSIHQPGYIPWLGFFKKIMSSDIFVFLDDVQYEKNEFLNRNRIRTSDGSMWLTVPIKSSLTSLLKEVKIENTTNWANKHQKSILINYSKATHFQKYHDFIENLYQKHFDFLIDINMEIIYFVMKELEMKTKTIFASELNISEKGSDRILSICKALDSDVYLSGMLGKNYLRMEDFRRNNIAIQFQNFQHPVYSQVYDDFIPNMSIIDLLFNEGKKSKDILLNSPNF